jgi:hypothetical protein
MEKLSWFKFTPRDWAMGKIQRCPEVTQARFMRLCCVYWNKDCVLTFDEADIEVDKEHLDILINKKIIKLENGFIGIDFLDQQLFEISKTSKKRREAVNERWNKVRENDTSVSENDTSAIQTVYKTIQSKSKSKNIDNNIILNKSLLSEIKISDDKKFLIFKDLQLEVSEDQIDYFKRAVAFQKLFIKNLKEKSSTTTQVENANYKNFVVPIRLMFEKDKITTTQLLDAYNYLNSPEGEFWKSNILSTFKLREKLPTLLAKKNTKSVIEVKKESLTINPNKRKSF